MKFRNSLFLFFGLGLIMLFSESCRKEGFMDDPSAKLNFSTDTVLFDTVFTKLGGGPNPRSANRRFTVHNPHKETIKTSISLGRGQASPFRMNIDGIPTSAISDYEILPEDSIYVFVEVSVDPNNQSNPLIIMDSILFQTNGNIQDIKLVAWGQDAYYLTDSVLTGNVVWADATKPYVIFNSILVDENSSLTIQPGVRVHSSVDSRIFVAGTLDILGTKEQPVVFQGARLEHIYKNTPSQWWGIRFLPSSKNNTIRFAEVKNGVIGVEVDSLQTGGGFKLTIDNTSIKNMSAGGLVGYTAWIRATNVLAANCGQFTFLGELGGNYQLRHCTFANYNTTFLRSKPAFRLSNANYKDANGTVFANNLNFEITYCIIWGSLKEELVFFNEGQGTFAGTVMGTVLRTEIGGWDDSNLVNEDPRFKDYRELNFALDTLSPAKDKGLPLLTPQVTIDLPGELRDTKPDLGAYERIE